LIVGVLVAASILGIILTGAIINQNQIARGNETLANHNAATADAERIRAEQEADGRATQQVVAEAEQARAEREASIAFSRELAAEAVNNLGEEPERSVLLALQALKTIHTQEAEEALHRALPHLRLLHTMAGHEDGFSDLAYSPDGSRLVSTNWDGTIRVWETATGQELLLLSETEEEFLRERYRELAYSSDGSYFVTGGDDGTARVWDAATGELLTTYTGHRDILRLNDPDSPNWIIGLDVSPDSKSIATSDRAGLVKLWDPATGAELKTLDLSETAPDHWRLRFSPDGLRLIVFGYDPNESISTIRMIEIDSGAELFAIEGSMNSFDVSPDWSRLIFTEAYENVVHLWDLDAMAETARYSTGEVDNMAFSPNGSLFATLARDLDTVQLWETETGAEVMAMPSSHGHVIDIVFSPDGASLATTGWDRLLRVWDIGPDHELMTVQPFSEVGSPLVTQIRFSQDGTMLAAGGVAGGVSLWDPTTGERLLSLAGHDDWVGGLGFSPDGDRLASGADDKLVKVWDTTTGELLLTLAGHEDWVNNIAYSPDGATIASVGNDEQSFVWDATTGGVLHQLPLLSVAWGIAYSPDGTLLATGSLWSPGDENVTIWDVATGQVVRLIDNKEGADELLFSNDGSLLITGGVDGFVRIWEIATGQLLQEIEADQSVIYGASLSPDGTVLATAAAGSDVRLWDLQSGERLLTMDGSEEGIQLVEFTADGEQIVTAGGQSGYMRFLVLSVDELVDLAESRLTRALTDEECQEYLHMDSCPVE
jgi:WD40 repeat protein